MIRNAIFGVALLAAFPVLGDQPDMRMVIETHVLPGYRALARDAATLSAAATADCSPDNPNLTSAYHDAFDAWVAVSHLRFGPSEQDDRAFALAFWPDPRGSTPKALAALMQNEDSAVSSPEDFDTVSVAARGFYALEFLLFDPRFSPVANQDYHCVLVQAITHDILVNSAAILSDWKTGYGHLMAQPGNDTYRTALEAAQQVFTALSTGLEFTSQARLGRPMGTLDRPRPNRAEARRSGRSLRHVVLSLLALRELARLITVGNDDVDRAFEMALRQAEGLDDTVFAGVADPQGRLKVEILQQSIMSIQRILAEDIGPSLGIATGFNSLDGD